MRTSEAAWAVFNRIAPIDKATWDQLFHRTRRKAIARGEFFSKPGEPANEFALVVSGLFRVYHSDVKGRESVKAFRKEDELLAPFAELLQHQPSRTNIEAITDAQLLVFRYPDFEELAELTPALKTFIHRLVEEHFFAREQRDYDALQLSAAERYSRFRRDFPEHVNRIPQHQIASYIGVTPVALSRIRARARRPTD